MAVREEHAWGATHTGHRRGSNEDRFLIRHLEDSSGILLAVADGMGGEAGGGIAAQIVVDTLQQSRMDASDPENALVRVVNRCGANIRDMAARDSSLEGMGTTATVVLADGESACWAHVGDSRLYLFRSGNLEQITTDHTFVQELIDEGTMTEPEAARHPLRNMLDQCVGCAELSPDSGSFGTRSGDRLLLCSDGLTRHVPDGAIAAVLQSGSARQAVDALVQLALDAGGKDNVTAVILDVTNEPQKRAAFRSDHAGR
jgi:protein phosphatase